VQLEARPGGGGTPLRPETAEIFGLSAETRAMQITCVLVMDGDPGACMRGVVHQMWSCPDRPGSAPSTKDEGCRTSSEAANPNRLQPSPHDRVRAAEARPNRKGPRCRRASSRPGNRRRDLYGRRQPDRGQQRCLLAAFARPSTYCGGWKYGRRCRPASVVRRARRLTTPELRVCSKSIQVWRHDKVIWCHSRFHPRLRPHPSRPSRSMSVYRSRNLAFLICGSIKAARSASITTTMFRIPT
jgi:hypothetical protein